MARPLSREEFEGVKGLVDGRAEGMVDDGTYATLESAHEFAWEMVQDDVLYNADLAQWAEFHELGAAILEVDPKAIADGTKFTEYDEYLAWYREMLAPREQNVAELKRRLT